MKLTLTLLAALLIVGGAQASDVFKTTDAKGQPIYTDRPDTLPAQKVDIKTQQTDMVEAQKRYDAEMKSFAKADKASTDASQKAAGTQKTVQLSAEDRAKRCQDARARYDKYMNSRRLYEQGETDSDRRYLSDAEIDAARANAKKTMDEFCAGQ